MRFTCGIIHLKENTTSTLRGFASFFYKMKLLLATLILLLFFFPHVFSQQAPDSIGYHSAKKATIMSMVLPGLGQAYNKKYWKIPVIYAGFGTLYYFVKKNGTEYRNFREAYNIVATNDSAHFDNSYVVRYQQNLNTLKDGRNFYRRNLEFTYILSGMLYLLNIIDASVDGNLYNFDVSDDLSLRFEPVSNQLFWARGPTPGITLRFRF